MRFTYLLRSFGFTSTLFIIAILSIAYLFLNKTKEKPIIVEASEGKNSLSTPTIQEFPNITFRKVKFVPTKDENDESTRKSHIPTKEMESTTTDFRSLIRLMRLKSSQEEEEDLTTVNEDSETVDTPRKKKPSASNVASVKSEDELILTKPGRIPVSQRKFNNSAVEETIKNISTKIKDDVIRQMFINCFPNTLDTTVYFHDLVLNPISGVILTYTYIITGDISAMWPRDSTNQILPYIELAKENDDLRRLILGLINTQAEMIELYPYGNAFFPLKHWNSSISLYPSQYSKHDLVHPPYEQDAVYEAKYELDSLASFLYLSKRFAEATEDTSFSENPYWREAVELILETLRAQQGGTVEVNENPPYSFSRPTKIQSETINLKGIGNPVKRCGLIRSFFRPSDDSTIFQYHIPSNALTAVGLEGVAKSLIQADKFIKLANELNSLAQEIRAAIKKYGIVQHPAHGKVYAYEVDCYGSHIFMDDGNFPSLLTLPVFGFLDQNDTVYKNTRKYILSKDWNPYYADGKYPGIGSPHKGLQKPWPMAIAFQAMTTSNEDEISRLLGILKRTTSGSGFMHEAYEVNDPTRFSRPWFAWANSVFGELILYLDKYYPHLLKEKF